jgi:methionyl-tRNA synthetase
MSSAHRDTRPVVVIGGPPTTNGDLHIGHIAGPYLAADVHARYLRAANREVVFASGGDNSQTYVVRTAARLGTTPQELTTKCWGLIKGTFEATGIEVDGFAPTDDAYRSNVYDYVNRLHAKGKFRKRTVRMPYSERSGQFLVEGLVGGDCPVCLADSRGGNCETCGYWIDFDGLIDPFSLLDPDDKVIYREAEILVFPLEEYRDQLIAFYQAKAATWRPRVVNLMREMLARPLPDFPITYPLDWGMPAPFPETPGQVLNAWLEGMPASMYCTAYAQRQLGLEPPANDDAWRAEHDARLVFFVGFDNLFIWGVAHVAELIAHEGRYVLPDTILCNEFYELDNQKFATSRGHVVWARDLLAEVPRDIARFHLNLSAPEHARTSFSRATLEQVAAERLVGPWNQLAAALAKLTAKAGRDPLPVSPWAPARAAAIVSRFSQCFELASFSLNQAAELVTQHLERLRNHAVIALVEDLDRDVLRVRLGDLFLQVRALISGASPILIDLAASAAQAGDFEPSMSASVFDVTSTTAFQLPTLDLRRPAHIRAADPTPTASSTA